MLSRRKSSFIDRLIAKLPEMHLCGYRYCGPNTNLKKHLESNELGINELDCACKEHDIAYNESSELEWRCWADKLLVLRAMRRIYAKDSRIGERFAASLVSILISIKIVFCKIEICVACIRKWIISKRKKK